MEILDHIIDFFIAIWRADKRPEARRFTIGCFLMVLVFFALLAVIFWNVDTGPAR